MELIHMKYAVEVAKTKSITKAAENLFMSQPNLSRAIKELEESLGLQIFKRTSSGMIPTEQGEEFLDYARNILSQVKKIESIHNKQKCNKLVFNISSPDAVYIAHAFASMICTLPSSQNIGFNYTVTENLLIMDNINQNGHNLGIIRINSIQEKYYFKLIREKGLIADKLIEFQYIVLMSNSHPLSAKKDITYKDLSNYIELSGRAQKDPIPVWEAKNQLPVQDDKHIITTGHVSQFYLLSAIPSAYMWAPPVPAKALEHYPLIQRFCSDFKIKYTDYLIYRKNYNFNELDNKFISELQTIKNELLQPKD